MSNGNLINVMSSVIRGVLDGDVSPSQANAVNGTVSQIIKMAKLKIEHNETAIDTVFVPTNNAITSEVSSTAKIRSSVFTYVAENGETSFKQIATALDLPWQTVESIAKHESFSIKGNKVSLS